MDSITFDKTHVSDMGPVTALYEKARDRSAQGPGFSLGGPAYCGCIHARAAYNVHRRSHNIIYIPYEKPVPCIVRIANVDPFILFSYSLSFCLLILTNPIIVP